MNNNLIYYCHFGKNPISKEARKIFDNWEQKGYQRFEINETNFPIEQFLFAKTAYEAGKFAFVADVARIYYLFNFGGIYLDTDVQIVKRLDEFLKKDKLVLSFEYFEWEITGLNMGTIICPKSNQKLEKLLDFYTENEFRVENINELTINQLFAKIVFEQKLKINNLVQENNEYLILPANIFCKKSKKSYTIHHYAQSWKEKQSYSLKVRRYLGKKLKKVIGQERFNQLWKKN